MQRWHQSRRRRGAVLSILWPLGRSLRPLRGGGGALLLLMIVWPVIGRIGVVGAVVDMLSAEKKIMREDERARRRRGVEIKIRESKNRAGEERCKKEREVKKCMRSALRLMAFNSGS
jgi:hypothetical protein